MILLIIIIYTVGHHANTDIVVNYNLQVTNIGFYSIFRSAYLYRAFKV